MKHQKSLLLEDFIPKWNSVALISGPILLLLLRLKSQVAMGKLLVGITSLHDVCKTAALGCYWMECTQLKNVPNSKIMPDNMPGLKVSVRLGSHASTMYGWHSDNFFKFMIYLGPRRTWTEQMTLGKPCELGGGGRLPVAWMSVVGDAVSQWKWRTAKQGSLTAAQIEHEWSEPITFRVWHRTPGSCVVCLSWRIKGKEMSFCNFTHDSKER